MVFRRGTDERFFKRHDRNGEVRIHRTAFHLVCVRAQAARQVNRNHIALARTEKSEQFLQTFRQNAGKSRAEHRVNNNVRFL